MSINPSDGTPGPWRAVRATIRSRLLVNALADPDEAARRLPPGVRPQVIDGGTVIGHCLVDLDRARPAGLPVERGIRLQVVADRIGVQWEDADGATVTGVYTRDRRTSSRLACALGGRWFPGAHHRAPVVSHDVPDAHGEHDPGRRPDRGRDEGRDRTQEPRRVTWRVRTPSGEPERTVWVDATFLTASVGPETSEIAAACLLPHRGLSPGHGGALDQVQMQVDHRRGRAVTVHGLASGFLDSFSSLREAPALVVPDLQVLWSARPHPTGAASIARQLSVRSSVVAGASDGARSHIVTL